MLTEKSEGRRDPGLELTREDQLLIRGEAWWLRKSSGHPQTDPLSFTSRMRDLTSDSWDICCWFRALHGVKLTIL